MYGRFGCTIVYGLFCFDGLFYAVFCIRMGWTSPKSKWCLPRDRIVQSSKEGSVFQRPRMKVHGVWNHGVSLNLFLIHPGVAADSSLVIETFQRVLQDTVQTFEKCGRPLPSACCIWVPWNVHSSDSCACVFHCLLVDCERSG